MVRQMCRTINGFDNIFHNHFEILYDCYHQIQTNIITQYKYILTQEIFFLKYVASIKNVTSKNVKKYEDIKISLTLNP